MTSLHEQILGPGALGPTNLIPNKVAHLKRFPFVFLVDTSGSTGQGADPDIAHINTAIAALIDKFRNPPPGTDLALRRGQIDLCIIAYNDDPTTFLPWTTIDNLPPGIPMMTPGGYTQTAKALSHALGEIGNQLRSYRGSGTPSGMPHIIHLTDGAPTDMAIGDPVWEDLKQKLSRLDGSSGQKAYARIINFISPRGMTGTATTSGAPLTGMELITELSGKESVHPLGNGVDRFENLIRMVTVIISRVSSGFDTKRAVSDAIREGGIQ